MHFYYNSKVYPIAEITEEEGQDERKALDQRVGKSMQTNGWGKKGKVSKESILAFLPEIYHSLVPPKYDPQSGEWDHLGIAVHILRGNTKDDDINRKEKKIGEGKEGKERGKQYREEDSMKVEGGGPMAMGHLPAQDETQRYYARREALQASIPFLEAALRFEQKVRVFSFFLFNNILSLLLLSN